MLSGFPRPQTKVFVASSSATLSVAEALRRSLTNEETLVVPWKDLGVFTLSEHTIESLEKAANQCQFAVFVLGPDDVVQHRAGESFVPRDNVVFELGLFLGRIGRKRSYMLRPKGIDVKLPSDLSGVTWAQYIPPGTHMNHVRDACAQIAHAMQNAPKTPSVELLSATVLPKIIIKHAYRAFNRYMHTRLKLLVRPRFQCDAQVTVCNREGRIARHPRVSSIGQDATDHEGNTIWSTLAIVNNSRPFELLFQNEDRDGWVVWTDSGYSQLYSPISGRHNHRICVARTHWTRTALRVLEIHQELETELGEHLLAELGQVIGERILQVEEEEQRAGETNR